MLCNLAVISWIETIVLSACIVLLSVGAAFWLLLKTGLLRQIILWKQQRGKRKLSRRGKVVILVGMVMVLIGLSLAFFGKTKNAQTTLTPATTSTVISLPSTPKLSVPEIPSTTTPASGSLLSWIVAGLVVGIVVLMLSFILKSYVASKLKGVNAPEWKTWLKMPFGKSLLKTCLGLFLLFVAFCIVWSLATDLRWATAPVMRVEREVLGNPTEFKLEHGKPRVEVEIGTPFEADMDGPVLMYVNGKITPILYNPGEKIDLGLVRKLGFETATTQPVSVKITRFRR